jgi:hypothetical protein
MREKLDRMLSEREREGQEMRHLKLLLDKQREKEEKVNAMFKESQRIQTSQMKESFAEQA